jgi:hypothetical protein
MGSGVTVLRMGSEKRWCFGGADAQKQSKLRKIAERKEKGSELKKVEIPKSLPRKGNGMKTQVENAIGYNQKQY